MNTLYTHKRNIQNLQNYINNKIICINDSIPCSIKPNYLVMPKDVNVRNIFLNMIENSKNDDYSIYFKNLSKKDKFKRMNYLKIIKNFIQYHNIRNSIFLYTIFLFDVLIKKNNNIFDMEILSLGALILSIKFNYETINNFTNRNFRYFGGNNYTSEELSKIELNCLLLLNHKLNYVQPINYLELFFLNGIVFTNDNILTEDSNFVYSSTLILLEELMKMNNLYLNYNPFDICCSIIALCRSKFSLEIWPKFLKVIFKKNLSDFQNCLMYVKECFKNFQIKYEYYENNNNTNNNYYNNSRKLSSENMTNKYNTGFNENYYNLTDYGNIKNDNINEKYCFTEDNFNINKNNLLENSCFISPRNKIKKPISYNYIRNAVVINKKSFTNSEMKDNNILNSIKKENGIRIYKKENNKNNNENSHNLHSINSNNSKFYKDDNKNKYNNISLGNSPKNQFLKKNILLNPKKINFSYIKNISQSSIEENKISNERRNVSLDVYHTNNNNNQDNGIVMNIFNHNHNNNNLSNNFPLSFLHKRVRNLSGIVNHLYSNHTNNIL